MNTVKSFPSFCPPFSDPMVGLCNTLLSQPWWATIFFLCIGQERQNKNKVSTDWYRHFILPLDERPMGNVKGATERFSVFQVSVMVSRPTAFTFTAVLGTHLRITRCWLASSPRMSVIVKTKPRRSRLYVSLGVAYSVVRKNIQFFIDSGQIWGPYKAKRRIWEEDESGRDAFIDFVGEF